MPKLFHPDQMPIWWFVLSSAIVGLVGYSALTFIALVIEWLVD